MGHHVPMEQDDEDIAETVWREGFRKRIVAARGSRTQDVMAELLEINQSTYSKYEGSRKSQMPIRLLPRFCKICGITLEYLIEGKEPATKIAPRKRKKTKAA